MPTYTCWSEPGVVAPEAKALIAKALTEIHHEVAVAPRYFVQVVFAELQANSIFIAGRPAPPGSTSGWAALPPAMQETLGPLA